MAMEEQIAWLRQRRQVAQEVAKKRLQVTQEVAKKLWQVMQERKKIGDNNWHWVGDVIIGCGKLLGLLLGLLLGFLGGIAFAVASALLAVAPVFYVISTAIIWMLIFIFGYSYCILEYGFLLGGSLGFLASLIAASVGAFVWPILAIVLVVAISWSASCAMWGGIFSTLLSESRLSNRT